MRRALRAAAARAGAGAAVALLLAVVLALALNVTGRAVGLSVVAAPTVAQWAFALLGFAALPSLVGEAGGSGPAGWLARLVAGFAVASLAAGLVDAAGRIGGVEPVLGWPASWRYVAAAGFAAAGLVTLLWRGGVAGAFATAAGAGLAIAPLPPVPALAGAAVFALALAVRVPVALALLAAVAAAPGVLSPAALAQTVMRGLGSYVLLAVPLFMLAASLMMASGIGERVVTAARWLARRRRTALGEANVMTSLLFGGVSGSSIADAAMNARLLAPAMVAAGYRPAAAAAVTAASSLLPNVLPPSIALLLAAAATDQSVGALWLAGVGAGLVLALALWLAVRLMPPALVDGAGGPGEGAAAAPEADSHEPDGRGALAGLLPPATVAVGVLGGLRLGLVTAVEAGLLAIAIAGVFAGVARGPAALWAALVEAAPQAGRVALLIAAATPIGFLFAASGVRLADVLPQAPSVAMLAAVATCLLVGTFLDSGAAILLFLPMLLPAAVVAGYEPVHATLVLTVALLLGGLTPPVGVLVLVVKEVTGAGGVYRAVLPYLATLLAALMLLMALPALTVGLVRIL